MSQMEINHPFIPFTSLSISHYKQIFFLTSKDQEIAIWILNWRTRDYHMHVSQIQRSLISYVVYFIITK